MKEIPRDSQCSTKYICFLIFFKFNFYKFRLRKTLVVVIRTFMNGFCDRLIQYLAMIITKTLVVVSTYPKHNF